MIIANGFLQKWKNYNRWVTAAFCVDASSHSLPFHHAKSSWAARQEKVMLKRMEREIEEEAELNYNTIDKKKDSDPEDSDQISEAICKQIKENN